MKGQCFILENVMDNSWQTFNLNTVQVQKLLLLEWSSYCAILFFGRKRMPKSAPDALHSPTKYMFSIFNLIPHIHMEAIKNLQRFVKQKVGI